MNSIFATFLGGGCNKVGNEFHSLESNVGVIGPKISRGDTALKITLLIFFTRQFISKNRGCFLYIVPFLVEHTVYHQDPPNNNLSLINSTSL